MISLKIIKKIKNNNLIKINFKQKLCNKNFKKINFIIYFFK